jgi:hypothetical protein
MVDKEEILKELKTQFEKTKKELGFKATFEEISYRFYLEDGVLSDGFVSNNFERQLCSRMVSTYYSWLNELHGWFMPVQGNAITHTETKGLKDEDREIIKFLMKKAMYFYREDKINGINHDKKAMGKLVDEMVKDSKDFFDKLNTLLGKTRDIWKKELDKK